MASTSDIPPLTKQCVFTIKNLDDLNLAFLNGGVGHFIEKKPWVTARKILDAAKPTSERVPILFSDAEDVGVLHYWALLTAIEIDGRTTTYHFEHLRRFVNKPKQSVLGIADSGDRLSPNHIRPYVLCWSPASKSSLYKQMNTARRAGTVQSDNGFDPTSVTDERKRVLQEITMRRGQSGFRDKLMSAYRGKCAVTACDASEALEAAHIGPYLGKGSQHVANGLLLRADIHTLFDLDLIGIAPDTFEIALASGLLETSYADLQGKKLALPSNAAHRPNKGALAQRWKQFSAK